MRMERPLSVDNSKRCLKLLQPRNFSIVLGAAAKSNKHSRF